MYSTLVIIHSTSPPMFLLCPVALLFFVVLLGTITSTDPHSFYNTTHTELSTKKCFSVDYFGTRRKEGRDIILSGVLTFSDRKGSRRET